MFIDLGKFTPGLYDILQSNVTVSTTAGKLVGANNRRCFLFASTFPNPAVADPQIRLNGSSDSNPIIRLDDVFRIRLNWWEHSKAVTQELWIIGLGGPTVYNVTEIVELPRNRKRVYDVSKQLGTVEAGINRHIQSGNSRGRFGKYNGSR